VIGHIHLARIQHIAHMLALVQLNPLILNTVGHEGSLALENSAGQLISGFRAGKTTVNNNPGQFIRVGSRHNQAHSRALAEPSGIYLLRVYGYPGQSL